VAAGAAERVGVAGIWAWGAAAAVVAGAAHCRWRVRLFLWRRSWAVEVVTGLVMVAGAVGLGGELVVAAVVEAV
jgi:hypothetical protein